MRTVYVGSLAPAPGDEPARRALTYGVARDERRQAMLDALDHYAASGALEQDRADHVRGALLTGNPLALQLLHSVIRDLAERHPCWPVVDEAGAQPAYALVSGTKQLDRDAFLERKQDDRARAELLDDRRRRATRDAAALAVLKTGVVELVRTAHWTPRDITPRRERSARTPCRPRVLTTPAPSNAPPTGRAMPALSTHAPP